MYATTDNYLAVSLIIRMGLFGRISNKKPAQKDVKTVSYDEALRTGSSIGKLITNIWNSQKNPGKAYLLNRRVHHGEIGILLGVAVTCLTRMASQLLPFFSHFDPKSYLHLL